MPTYGKVFDLTWYSLDPSYHGSIPSFAYQHHSPYPAKGDLLDTRGVDVCGEETDYSGSYSYTNLVKDGVGTAFQLPQ